MTIRVVTHITESERAAVHQMTLVRLHCKIYDFLRYLIRLSALFLLGLLLRRPHRTRPHIILIGLLRIQFENRSTDTLFRHSGNTARCCLIDSNTLCPITLHHPPCNIRRNHKTAIRFRFHHTPFYFKFVLTKRKPQHTLLFQIM